MTSGLTISQAAVAGVTVKIMRHYLRHYHRLGLVDEPRRGSSGYRRYGSSDLLQPVQVHTLADVKRRLTDAPRALTNKYYRTIKTICFDGAMMDKLTSRSAHPNLNVQFSPLDALTPRCLVEAECTVSGGYANSPLVFCYRNFTRSGSPPQG